MTALLHAPRLASRAVDGWFAPAELPALLARPMLFGLHGRLLLEQEGGVRLFTWRAGRLMGVDGTGVDESLAPFAARVAGERRLPRIEQSVLRARGTGQPLALELHRTGGLDPSLVLAAEQAQARHIVAAALAGGPAMAWFDRDQGDGVVPSLDGFEALWHGVAEAYDDFQLVALARALEGRTRPSDVGIALVRQLAVDPALGRLTVSAQCVSESDHRLLGALVLCGLATFAGEPVPAPSARALVPEPTVASHAPPRRRPGRVAGLAPALGITAVVSAGLGGFGLYLVERAAKNAPPPVEVVATASDLVARAESLVLQGAGAEALVLLEQEPSLMSGAAVQRVLGAARAQTGDLAGATVAYRTYLALRPDAPDRVEIERALGRLATGRTP
jgi:hypothetical protein